MYIQVWFTDRGQPVVKIDDMQSIYDVPHYRIGTLADLTNAYGKVRASAAGWVCNFPEGQKQKIADWLLTVPSKNFVQV